MFFSEVDTIHIWVDFIREFPVFIIKLIRIISTLPQHFIDVKKL